MLPWMLRFPQEHMILFILTREEGKRGKIGLIQGGRVGGGADEGGVY